VADMITFPEMMANALKNVSVKILQNIKKEYDDAARKS